MAIPKAMANVIAVLGRNGIWKKPNTAAMIIMGIILGNTEIKAILTDRKRNAIKIVITPKAIKKLPAKFSTK